MAGKTPTELGDLIAELRTELAILNKDLALLRSTVEGAEFAQVRERVSKLEALLALLDGAGLVRHVAVLQDQVAELKKWKEESDRRRWQLVVGVFLAVLAFSANLIVTFVRKPG